MIPEAQNFFRSIELSDVTLRVRDLARVAAFYRNAVGLSVVSETMDRVELSTATTLRKPNLIVLEHAPTAPERPPGTAGLFHTAILFPDRAALGRVARRLIEREIEFGTGDHGVSEALYLEDPEGNGVELYADRAPAEWPAAGANGEVTMYTKPVDVPSLLAEGGAETMRPIPAETRIGHLHLCVANLEHSEEFFSGVLGFPVRQRSYPGALFMGRDGYHHHLGANVWRSRSPALEGALGLKQFTVSFADEAELDRVSAAAESGGYVVARGAGRLHSRTRDGLGILLRARGIE